MIDHKAQNNATVLCMCILWLHPGKKQLLQQRKQQAESQSLIIVLQLKLNIVNYGTIVLSFPQRINWSDILS